MPTPSTTYYTVSFNANGHGTAPASQSVAKGNRATKPADLTAEGYTFGGWYKEASCTNAYDFAATVTADITLYAKWTKDGGSAPTPTPVTTYYTVSFNANGGEGTMNPQTFTSGVAQKLEANAFTRDDYRFIGWASNDSATSVEYADQQEIKVNENTTLYAVWEEVALPYIAITSVSNTGKKIVLKWGKVKGVKGYDVFMTYCGEDYPDTPTATVKKNKGSVTIKKIGGSAINQEKQYKFFVRAYKVVDGKKVYVSKSLTGHGVGYKNTKYTDVKKLTLKKASYSLKAGKTQTIEATVIKRNKKKELVTHVEKFRYRSSDKSVATVSADGKITAKGKGKCTIYVVSVTGLTKKITVTVK